MLSEKRLIDANALMEYIHNHDYELVSRMGCVDKGMFTEGIEHGINIQPTVDAVEVVHARWEERYIPNGKYVAWDGSYCSACGNKAAKSHYCPNCGAKMDGGNEDGLHCT